MDFPHYQPEGNWKIMLAMDGSEHSLAALALLSDLPLPPEASITVVGVFLPRNASDYYLYEPILRQAEDRLRQRGVQAHSELLAGRPSEVLHQLAEDQHPRLIVLGAKGRRATSGILLGGVAQQMVEYGSSPVLVVRSPYTGLERILLVTDGSPASQYSVEYITRLPLPEHTSIEVVHVLPPIPLPQPMVAAPVWSLGYERSTVIEVQTEEEMRSMFEEEKKAGEALLESTLEHLRQLLATTSPRVPITSALLLGDAATEIIGFANSHKANLIVAGSRGLTSVKGWLLGSVSRKLLHYAPCSVLVVRGLPA